MKLLAHDQYRWFKDMQRQRDALVKTLNDKLTNKDYALKKLYSSVRNVLNTAGQKMPETLPQNEVRLPSIVFLLLVRRKMVDYLQEELTQLIQTLEGLYQEMKDTAVFVELAERGKAFWNVVLGEGEISIEELSEICRKHGVSASRWLPQVKERTVETKEYGDMICGVPVPNSSYIQAYLKTLGAFGYKPGK